MKITKTHKSRLDTTDFSRLRFGRVFSDHMLRCVFSEGKWQDPEIIPYGPIPMNPGSQVLHYGQSIFEGMKAFKNPNNELLFFRKEENFNRLNKSAVRMSIPKIPRHIFILRYVLELHLFCVLTSKFFLLFLRALGDALIGRLCRLLNDCVHPISKRVH